jgi:hypothetical protein
LSTSLEASPTRLYFLLTRREGDVWTADLASRQ